MFVASFCPIVYIYLYLYIFFKFHSQEEMHGPSQNLKHGHIFVVALCLVAKQGSKKWNHTETWPEIL